MSESFGHLISPLVGLSANVVIQVAGFRFHSRLSMLKSIFLGFAAGFVVVVALDTFFFFTAQPLAWTFVVGIILANILTYFALGYGYFHFINLGETARRVRILREIYDSPSGLSIDEILARYNGKAILQYRMDRLLGNGQVILDQEKYKIGNPSMLYITKIILFLKLIILGKKSEFE